ncbi:MAG: C25 family peptidase propeptide domain-containing protein, partial [Candidatus Cloacimonadales bacterium]|nr:C25 family peptidase propeptide domain-containing protein [Candidatus Cloacimonadales bacterium]
MKIKLLIMFLLAGIAQLSAGVVQQEFSFTEPEFSIRDGFDKVAMENLNVITKPGYPELPVMSVQMLLPPGEEAVSVQVSYDQVETLDSSYNVYPIQKPYPTSYEGEIEFVPQNEEIYSRNAFYPEVIYSDLTTQYLRGHSIALLNISPLQYNPQTGEILFYSNLTVTIQTQTTAASQRAFNNFYRGNEQTNQRLSKLVINPQSISQYPASENTREVDDFEYIIVTTNSYLTELV